MANSTTYVSQSKQLNENLQKWNIFVSSVIQVIESYQENITALQKQINNNAIGIEGLQYKILSNNTNYIKLNTNTITIKADANTVYTQSFVVFTNDDVTNVTISSNKSVSGLKVGGANVSKGNFFNFTGSITGQEIQITTSGMIKTNNRIILTLMAGTETTTLDIIINFEPVRSSIITFPAIINGSTKISKFTDAIDNLNTKNLKNIDIINKIPESILNTSSATVQDLTKQLGITVSNNMTNKSSISSVSTKKNGLKR